MLSTITGVGPKTLDKLKLKGIESCNDLILFYPISYQEYKEEISSDSKRIMINGTISSKINTYYGKNKLVITNFTIDTPLKTYKVIAYNHRYLSFNFKTNMNVIAYLNMNDKGDYQLEKIVEEETSFNGKSIFPIYSNIKGLTSNKIQTIIMKVINNIENENLKELYRQIHSPKTMDELNLAIYKVKYNEFKAYYEKIKKIKEIENENNIKYIKNVNRDDVAKFCQKLSFELTNDQKKVINKLVDNFLIDRKSQNLIVGDVATGKTMIGFIMAFCMINQGYQVAIMAPTQLLAQQIFDEANKYFALESIALLTSSTTKSKRKKILQYIELNITKLIIGTHSLIQSDVVFSNLGLVIIDEQQRFGVLQRQKLIEKSSINEIIYLTATPIPRTLSKSLFGMMDILYVKEKPSVSLTNTSLVREINDVYKKIETQLLNKQQIFVVVTLIEKIEGLDLLDQKSTLKILKQKFPNAIIKVINGQMKEKSKLLIMEEFKNKEIDILIATTVIEVGIDIENATSIIIMNAERFGISQLHQLRGRVGRNNLMNDCILYDTSTSQHSVDRLNQVVEHNDGFLLAKLDLETRGSGDYTGIKQSGNPDFHIFDMQSDFDIAQDVINDDKRGK